MTRTLVLIDGTNYAFRAFYALPPMSTATGFPTNALYGFASMLLSYLKSEPPDYMVVAFDAPGPTLRKQKYPKYKAHRKPVPPELLRQLPFFRSVTEALGISYFELTGYEADDIIATIVDRAQHDSELNIRIVSTDKDLMQLVSDRVTGVDTIRNLNFDPAAVEKKWGVPPNKLRDLLALQGDASDNVPGVPGIGPKKARDLVQEYGSVPQLLEQLPNIRNAKLREALTQHAEAARLSLDLVTLETNVPLDTPLLALALKPPNTDQCKKVFEGFEFRRLLDAIGFSAVVAPHVEARTAKAPLDVQEMLGALNSAPVTALATVRSQSNSDVSFALILATSPEKAWIVDIERENSNKISPIREPLARFLSDPACPKVGHDVKKDLVTLRRHGFTLNGLAGDTRVAAYLLNPSRPSYELPDLIKALLHQPPPDDTTENVEVQSLPLVLSLHNELLIALKTTEMEDLYRNVEVPLISLLAEMEEQGIKIDIEKLKDISADLDQRMIESEARIFEFAGVRFNPNSPKQLQEILFEKLKLPVVKKTKTGPSTDQSVLETLADQHPLPDEILAYRSLAKLKNTYVDALPLLVDGNTSRIHTTFNQTVAATGRLSSSDPNLQNIPIRAEEGKKIRQAFVAPPGLVMMSADYSQIELRLLAHMSNDETLTRAFAQGDDVHAATASEIFGVARPLVTTQMRRSAKAINFGIIYGMGGFRLARELKISRKEADRYIRSYFERYSQVKSYLDGTLEQARDLGYVTTILMRRRYVPELASSNHAARQAAERIVLNTPIQGSAADIIKLAMLHVRHSIKEAGLCARMLLQVHDELLFEIPTDEVDVTRVLVKKCMEDVMRLRVPLVVDIGLGSNWAEAH